VFCMFFCTGILVIVRGHGFLKEPIARTAIQLRPDFSTHEPYVEDYSGLQCESVLQDANYSTCGRCGEGPGLTENSQGGMYDKGIIIATYQSGAVVEMTVEFLAGHYGHFEIELCPQSQETDVCFQKLPILSSNEEVRDGNRICVPFNSRPCGSLCGPTREIWARVWLPPGVTCGRCTIRWNYRTSYPGRQDWDICDNPTPTQIFRNCADVAIV